MKATLIILIISVFLPTTLLADSAAASIANGIVNKSERVDDPNVPNRGREYALDQVSQDAGTGAAVAGATGAALTGAATAQFLLGNWATGGALMTMAGLEFAQMGASQNASRMAGFHRDILTENGSLDLSKGSTEMGTESRPTLPENVDKFLAKSGIDPVLFKDALFSGKLTDMDSVLEALGKRPGSISREEVERAQQEAQSIFAKTAQEVTDSMGIKPSQATLIPGSNDGEVLTQINAEASDKSEAKRKSEKTKEMAQSSDAGSDFTDGAISQNFLAGLFGPATDTFTVKDQQLLFDSYLKDQGLVRTRPGMNIFQVAQQNYRAFSKWRVKAPKKNRVASLN
jgi:hypothetical protein